MEQSNSFLQNYGVKRLNIFLTHSHHDHIDGITFLLNHFQCQLYVSALEWSIWSHKPDLVEQNVTKFKHAQVLKFDDVRLKCLLTPGHTQGSSCFMVNDRYLLSGDTLFIEGCGLCGDYPQSDGEMFTSLQQIKTLADDL
ncbi:MBL fold metallo-hydrolase [Bombilactobacillus folatiphilus]|uniref:MBL fold metallo-hydrolase n=1 Tax=Bombilactobacillus folatiphilus TaxID=2923362 RepID=A0ABY4PAN6_9LACO|nr:MBL fold metallo-hydrolase [Bombilactobacillus folatiphilus]UQS82813.1 MBL fold metallo-hydrolase [Bombilactobacillus folatiphilus]